MIDFAYYFFFIYQVRFRQLNFTLNGTVLVQSKLVLLNSCYPWTDRIHSLSFIWFNASLFTNTYAKTIPVGDVVYVRDNTIAKDKFKKIYNEKGKD